MANNIPIDEHNKPDFGRTFTYTVLITVITYLIMFGCQSCSTTREVVKVSHDTITTVKWDSVYIWSTINKVDTFFQDRVLTLVLNDKGDTLKHREDVYVRRTNDRVTNSGEKESSKDSSKVSSMSSQKTTETTQRITWWQKVQISTWWPLLVLLIISISINVIVFYYRRSE